MKEHPPRKTHNTEPNTQHLENELRRLGVTDQMLERYRNLNIDLADLLAQAQNLHHSVLGPRYSETDPTEWE